MSYEAPDLPGTRDGDAWAMLTGRSAECMAVDRLLRQVRNSRSGSLVVRGQPGIGKSAILGYAADLPIQ